MSHPLSSLTPAPRSTVVALLDDAMVQAALDRVNHAAQAPRTVVAPLGRTIVSQAGRHQFYTVRLRDGVALPAFKGSGEITSLSQADGYIEIPSEQSVVDEGTAVTVTLF